MTTTIAEHPARNQATETWLDDLHITWTFNPELPIDTIDLKKSAANQARLEPINPDVVQRYTADLERGNVFPAVVAHHQPRRKAVIVGGNHRLHAHLAAKRTTIAAYLIQAAPEMVLRLTYEDNRRHGLPPSDNERITQAIHLIDNGWTQEAAAATVGIAAPRISQHRKLADTTRRAITLALPQQFHQLPAQSRLELGRLRSDPVFTEAAKLALVASLSGPVVAKLCRRLTAARSEADALSIIGTEVEEHTQRIGATAGGQATKATARATLQRALSTIIALDPGQVAATTPNADVGATVKDQITRAARVLAAVDKALR